MTALTTFLSRELVVPTLAAGSDRKEGHERYIFTERFTVSEDVDQRTFTAKYIAPRVEKICKQIEAEADKRGTIPRFLKLEAPGGIQCYFSEGGEFRVIRAFDICTGEMAYSLDALVVL